MTDDDRELLTELSLLAQRLGSFALGVMDDTLSRGQQVDLGTRLVNLAERIRDRAMRTAVVIEGHTMTEECVILPPTTVEPDRWP